MMHSEANRSRAFLAKNRAHFSTIDPFSDSRDANSLHRDRKKTHQRSHALTACIALLTTLGACEKAADVSGPIAEPPIGVDVSCDNGAFLSTELYGSIERRIDWSAEELRCESMLRPNGEGVRLRFTGEAAGSQLAIILALPELKRGATGSELPTVITLTVEGSGRFFSTPSAGSCWTDIAGQDPLDDFADKFTISGTLYCVAPLGEINGDAAISIPEMAFRGIVDWGAT